MGLELVNAAEKGTIGLHYSKNLMRHVDHLLLFSVLFHLHQLFEVQTDVIDHHRMFFRLVHAFIPCRTSPLHAAQLSRKDDVEAI